LDAVQFGFLDLIEISVLTQALIHIFFSLALLTSFLYHSRFCRCVVLLFTLPLSLSLQCFKFASPLSLFSALNLSLLIPFINVVTHKKKFPFINGASLFLFPFPFSNSDIPFGTVGMFEETIGYTIWI